MHVHFAEPYTARSGAKDRTTATCPTFKLHPYKKCAHVASTKALLVSHSNSAHNTSAKLNSFGFAAAEGRQKSELILGW